EAGNAAFERLPATVHIDIEIDRLTDTQIAELRLLEVGIHPDLIDRADCHETLADLDIVARIDIAAGDDAIDFRDDVAVTEVEFGLCKITPGRFEPGLRLPDRRCRHRQTVECAVDVARTGLLELLKHLPGCLVVRMDNAQL